MSTNNHDYITIYCGECKHTFRVPVPCKNRFCDVCNSTRHTKVRRRLNLLVEHHQNHSKSDIRFLTLTIKNMTNLDAMVKALLKSFRRLRQRAGWKKRVTGGAFVIEVTRKNDTWHAHLHIVIAGDFFPFKVLLEMWREVSPGRGVYIKRIPPGKVVGYLTKYLSKPDSIESGSDLALVNNCLHGTRLFQPFGNWFGISNSFPKIKACCPQCKQSGVFIHEYEIYGFAADHVRKECAARPPPYIPANIELALKK